MTAFDRAWEIAKFDDSTPLERETELSRRATDALGLGEAFDQGGQRRVFDIRDDPGSVAKVPNLDAGGRQLLGQLNHEYPSDKDDFWEAFTYDRMKNVLPGVAEKYLLPAEQMTVDGLPVNAMKMPKVDMSWLKGQDSQYEQGAGPNRTPWNAFDGKLENWWDQLARDAYEEAKSNPKTSFEFGGKRGVNAQLLDELEYYFGSDNLNDIGPANYHAPNYPSTEGMRMLDYYAEDPFLGDFTTPSTPNMADKTIRRYPSKRI
tara:strand:- start:3495 stop:4277 length:783 start_codon:yes stop_codon:yes gene_type:complete